MTKTGIAHYNEHPLEITNASLAADRRTVNLQIPALAPTHCYELKLRLLGTDGEMIDRTLFIACQPTENFSLSNCYPIDRSPMPGYNNGTIPYAGRVSRRHPTEIAT